MARVKLFSVDQADRALPLVKRIINDLMGTFREREKRIHRRSMLPTQPNPGSDVEEQAHALEREIEGLEAELVRFQDELTNIGVELKDYRIGLLDFFSSYQGRIVYLCWKPDDGDRLAWWHDLRDGFRGRQPITPANRHLFQGLQPGERYVELRRE